MHLDIVPRTTSHTVSASRESVVDFRALVADTARTWQAPHPTFTTKLEEAARDPSLQSCSEQTERAIRSLLHHGLIVNTDSSTSSLGSFIVQHLLRPSTPYDLQLTLEGQQPMILPANTHMLFIHLAERLHCTMYVFSNRAMPKIYRPTVGSIDQSHVCGILHVVDSYLATSQYLVLSCVSSTEFRSQPGSSALVMAPSATSSTSSSSVPASSSSSRSLSISASSSAPSHGPQIPLNHARFRAHQRSPKRKREALDDDEKKLMKNALRAGW